MSTSNLLYSAVVLDDDNRAKLIKFVDGIIDISSTWKRIAHHMTMGFKKPVPDHLRNDIGKSVQLNVTELGISNDAIAVKVEGYHSDNKIPHITVAIPKNGKPFNSNLITKWYPVHQITLTGTVMEVKEIYSGQEKENV